MKIALLCGESRTVVWFRKPLIKELLARGCEVSVITLDDEYKQEIEALGVSFYRMGDSNRSTNPFKILTLKAKYKRLLKQIAPDVAFTFMLKPNVFGVTAAHAAHVPHIYSMVEGAGDVFINNGLKWKAIRCVVCFLYRRAFRHSETVFFLNKDDRAEFETRGLVRAAQCKMVYGVGVDLTHFAYAPLQGERTFLMIARMLRTKGVLEYCECARLVKEKYPDAEFLYLGAEGTVTLEQIRSYTEGGIVRHFGTTKDVRPYLSQATAFVLPSYREGMPMSVMEAQATGRAVITTDAVGCRDTVRDGYNGFIVPCRDAEALAQRVIDLIEHPDTARQMGEQARRYAEEVFDERKINEQICEVVLKL